MSKDIAVHVQHLSKTFVLPHEKQSSIKSAFINIFKTGKRTFELQHALKDVSFEIKQGEFFGIVGRNGSGKSTLLKLLAGIYTPTKGSIKINGRLTPFIELGVGFNPELTGRENVFLNGALLGFNRKEMLAMYDEIVAFAELERFMDQKLKNYSSGMQVRLAFSIAIRANSEILLIDEVLAVGDTNFQKKCFDVFKQIKRSGRTVIFVTHDMGAVEEYCDRAMLISNGDMLLIDAPSKVTKRYNELNLSDLAKRSQVDYEGQGAANSPAYIKNATIRRGELIRPQDQIEVVVEVAANQEVSNLNVGITIKDQTAKPLFATNTKVKNVHFGHMQAGETRTVEFTVENVFSDGTYFVVPAVADEHGRTVYDSLEEGRPFTVGGWDYPAFLVQPKHSIMVK